MAKMPADNGDASDTSVAPAKLDGPTPSTMTQAKPANSAMARQGSIAASQFDGPFGGKRPQS